MIIRDACLADMATVHRLIGQLADAPDAAEFCRRFERVLTGEGHRIQALVVDSEVRSSGAGEALMHEAEAWAISRGLPSASLYCRADRKRAHAFYERIGYRVKATSVRLDRAL